MGIKTHSEITRIVFMSSFMKTIIFSPNALPGTLSSDLHASNKNGFFCVPDECSSLRMYFIHLPIKRTTHNLWTVNIFSAPQNNLAMYNFSLSVTDHDNFLPAVIILQSPCHRSQCTSTHLATEDVHRRHYLRPRTVVPSTSNVAPTTSTVPTDTRTVSPPTTVFLGVLSPSLSCLHKAKYIYICLYLLFTFSTAFAIRSNCVCQIKRNTSIPNMSGMSRHPSKILIKIVGIISPSHRLLV